MVPRERLQGVLMETKRKICDDIYKLISKLHKFGYVSDLEWMLFKYTSNMDGLSIERLNEIRDDLKDKATKQCNWSAVIRTIIRTIKSMFSQMKENKKK